MLHFWDIFPWWTWLIGGVGLVGALAFLFLAPAIAAIVGERIAKAIAELIKTPVGAAIIVGAVMFFVGSAANGVRMRAECNAAYAAAKLEAAEARKKLAADITRSVEDGLIPIIGRLVEDAGNAQTWVDDYVAHELNTKPPADRCVLGAPALKLRDRGKKR